MRSPQSYSDALEGVTEIIHAASPFNVSPCDNVEHVLAPAKEISSALLEAVQHYEHRVRHVVNILSFAAMVDLSQGLRPGYSYSETDWNLMTYEEAATSSNGPAVYCASKGLVEAKMWHWVFGPSEIPLGKTTPSTSLNKLKALLDASSVPATDFAGFVDVRDVAMVAIKIIEMRDPPARRFLLGDHFDWQTAVDILRDAFPDLHHRIPVGSPGYVQQEPVYSLITGDLRSMLKTSFTSLEKTLQDTFQQFLSAK
ncbi:hypothetical protein N7493_000977 [Penicillium malachiteum]|uniref:Thioester reductase (TE) domain-containing protein n=1 Tax=Penicillium malachiteum TaxID=1324776 RepID=A0AAD6HXE9_9EURO|nr:hypothetical protein N7493_000977 [Penicillium malachiteum]